MKLTPQGETLWSWSAPAVVGITASAATPEGGVALVGAAYVTADLGNGVLCGPPSQQDDFSIFAVRLDASGQHVWSQCFDFQAVPRTVVVGPSGTVFFGGEFMGTIDLGTGPLTAPSDPQSAQGGDAFVAALSATDGSPLWVRAAGASYRATAQQLSVDAGGDLILSGWAPSTSAWGAPTVLSEGSAYVAHLDHSTGESLAVSSFAEPPKESTGNYGYAHWNAPTPDGGVVLAGSTILPIDLGGGPLGVSSTRTSAYVARYDAAGAHLWSRAFSASGGQLPEVEVWGVSVDPQGRVIVTGMFRGTIDFGAGPVISGGPTDVAPLGWDYDMFLLELGPSADLLSIRTFASSSGIATPSGVAFDPLGYPVVTGDFNGSVDFGQGSLGPTTFNENSCPTCSDFAFVAKLAP
ncbi:MAG: hypothetical protein U0271_22120 [Polyangiaceae bacterium]